MTTVGFTGSREGISAKQRLVVIELLTRLGVTELYHGDCYGADEVIHNLARQVSGVHIVVHPANILNWRSFCQGDEIRTPKQPLARNQDIVNESDLLIACPKEWGEVQRSGTWATIRRARKAGKTIYIIDPNGYVFKEE